MLVVICYERFLNGKKGTAIAPPQDGDKVGVYT